MRISSTGVWAAALAAAAMVGSSSTAFAEEQATVSAIGSYPDGKQELGVQLGLATGGRVTPGGAHIAGRYSYRLGDRDWFELGVGFTYGDNEIGCGRDSDSNQMSCDHNSIGGFSGEIGAGLRRYFLGRQSFTPYLRGGLSARVVSYKEDDVKGVAIPFWLGGGVRAPVAPGVFVGADAVLSVGAGIFNKNLGTEPQAAMTVMGSVEFSIGR